MNDDNDIWMHQTNQLYELEGARSDSTLYK